MASIHQQEVAVANTGRPDPKPNRLLAALERNDRERLDGRLEAVDLTLGEVLHEPWKARRWVYFPAGSIVSLLYETEDGETCEIAIVGNEGVVGASPCMGAGEDPARAVVQSAGPALRMRVGDLRREFESGGEVQRLLLRYMQTLLVQIAQSAVCNRHHSVAQQLCRWLLMSMDRLPSNRIVMTHQLIAHMLGVRREGVTEAAGKLQRAGAISYRRGRIEVLDRARLEALSCECYGVVRREFAHLLPWTYRG
jgi:CRP-like cAMP-binding protein